MYSICGMPIGLIGNFLDIANKIGLMLLVLNHKQSADTNIVTENNRY